MRGIFKTMGRAKKGKITKAASEARCYSLMAHDVTDIQVKEQNIIFIQYIQNTQVQFRFWPSTISQREPRCDGQEGLLHNKDRQEHIRRGPPVKLSARNGSQLVRTWLVRTSRERGQFFVSKNNARSWYFCQRCIS